MGKSAFWTCAADLEIAVMFCYFVQFSTPPPPPLCAAFTCYIPPFTAVKYLGKTEKQPKRVLTMHIFAGQEIPIYLDNYVTEILAKVTAIFCIKKSQIRQM